MEETYTPLAFPGRDRLLRRIDEAVALGDPPLVTRAVKDALSDAIVDPAIQLPACVRRPVPGHYARREIHRSASLGYSIITMCWAPGQGTPLHDHDAMWCVEGVWQGDLQITPYTLLEQQGERHRFRAEPVLYGHCGSTGSLIPPFEYHTLCNASEDAVAVSVHVYQAPMERSAVFEPLEEEGWYVRRVKCLGTDT